MPLDVEQVTATILLRGGHTCRVRTGPNELVLAALLTAIAERGSPNEQARMFNLEAEDGSGSVIFSSAEIIAMTTSSPLTIDLTVTRELVTPSWFVRENYLSAAELNELFSLVELRQKEFLPSRVRGGDPDARRSQVLYDLGPLGQRLQERLVERLPEVIAALGCAPFPIKKVEMQLTAHNHGDYFYRHLDAGYEDSSRLITFVYYFFKESKRFRGGELRIYDAFLDKDSYRSGKPVFDLDPKNNSIIFFPSFTYHEVLPIRCPSGDFMDSRFTVNGWINSS